MSTLVAEHITKTFKGASAPAVNDVSLALAEGECRGVVGESGSGKSTLASIMMNILTADSGSVLLDGRDITSLRGKRRRDVYRSMQMVFQNQSDSFDPRVRLGDSIAEFGIVAGMRRRESLAKAEQLLAQVGLSDEYLHRYPGEVSGGECQRAAIARALMVDPAVLVCDEITSALDVSVQANIIEIIERLKGSRSILFISHDLALVDNLCDNVTVMNHGRVVEWGSAHDVTGNPLHPYTRLLVSSVFPVEEDRGWSIPGYSTGEGDPPESGCAFSGPCPVRQDACKDFSGELLEVDENRWVACPMALRGIR